MKAVYSFIFFKMAALRKKRKFAAVNEDSQDEHPRNNFSRDTNVTWVNEEFIMQNSEEIKRKLTTKLCHKFSKIESRILGVFSKLDEFLLTSQVRVGSGTSLEFSLIYDRENQECNEERSQNGPHHEVGTSVIKSLTRWI